MRRRLFLALLLASARSALAATVTIAVDPAAARHAIDPRIYGVAFGTQSQLQALNCPLNRLGGNHSSRYNWNVDAYNRAAGYYFESLVETDFDTPGQAADDFIAASHLADAEAMMTIPMVGWVAKVGPNGERRCSFSIAKYGAQQDADPFAPDCGNGVHTNGSYVTGNDPTDANVAADQGFQQPWIAHMVATDPPNYYLYDNEPSIWFADHHDVHPAGAPMDEVRDKMIAYGTMIRGEDANAVLVGPEEWGWDGYFNSGQDLKYYQDNCSAGCPGPLPDREAHGGADYVPYLLDQLHQYDVDNGVRLLDVFAVHFYPQGDMTGHQEFSDDIDTATQQLRNRSTRVLWDPNYVDESYIGTEGIDNGHDMLIPRFKGWVGTYYPGTQVGITEYNWGAEGHINGATTQADILGIFGREGLDLATRWEIPDPSGPAYKTFQMYRNYDGAGAVFGDTSVSATSASDVFDTVSFFAAQRSSDNKITIMLVNKVTLSNAVTVNVAGAGDVAAERWELNATTHTTITPLADVPVAAGALSVVLPAQSITLLVLPGGPAPPTVASPTATAIAQTTATLGGNVTGDGGDVISERGVVYAKTSDNADPTIGGANVSQATTAGTTGVFTVGVNGLTRATAYSYKAYATNGQGTGYTSAGSFTTLPDPPTVASPTATGITSATATLGGDVTDDGGGAITGRGVVYAATSVNASPAIGGFGVTKLTAAGTTGVFSVGASGLSPATGYSFAAYATNSGGTSYSGVATFTTLPAPPTVTAPTATAIGVASATLGGSVTSDGGDTISGRGVVYAPTSVNPNPAIGGLGVIQAAAAGTTGTFTVDVSSLLHVTTYSFRAYATNSVGTSYTAPVLFTTKALGDLAVTNTDGRTLLRPGQRVTYTVVVTNAGPDPVRGAHASDAFTRGITIVGWTCSGRGGATCGVASGSGALRGALDLPAGSAATYTLRGLVGAAGTGSLTSTASVPGPAGVVDPNLANNAAVDTDVVAPAR